MARLAEIAEMAGIMEAVVPRVCGLSSSFMLCSNWFEYNVSQDTMIYEAISLDSST